MSRIPENIRKLIQKERIQYIRFIWCDQSGVIGAKAVYVGNHKQTVYPDVNFPKAMLPTRAGNNKLSTSYFGTGDILLRPDWSTFTGIPYAPGQAKVFCYLYDGDTIWGNCPRGFLNSMILKAKKLGLTFKFSFENEFYLLRQSDNGFIPVDDSIFGQIYPLDLYNNFFLELTEALTAQSILPTSYHAESGKGQYELAIKYQDTLSAADQQITLKETVRAIAQKHCSIKATFLPKPFISQAGSGAHIHFSIWQNGKNITPDRSKPNEISLISRSFIAGILSHARGLLCLTAPSVNSYNRFTKKSWSGSYICWGYNNRNAMIRIPRITNSMPITNIEYKPADGTSNPYMALGALIASGLHGIEEHMELSDDIRTDPETMPTWLRARRRIYMLPQTLGEAIQYYSKDNMFKVYLGEDLFNAISILRDCDWNDTRKISNEKEILLLSDRY